MLWIRPAQQEVLSRYVVERYVDRVARHVRKLWPDRCATLGDDAVRDSIHGAIKRMQSAGVTSELQVVRFVNLMYAFDWDLGSSGIPDEVSAILDDNTLAEQEKLDRIYALVDPEFIVPDEDEEDDDEDEEDEDEDEDEDDEFVVDEGEDEEFLDDLEDDDEDW